MKRNISTMLAALMVLVMGLAMIGCGSKPTLDEWYSQNQSEFQTMLDQANASVESTGISMDIVVEDSNVLVYKYTMTEAFPTDEDSLNALKTTADSQFDSYETQFSELTDQLQSETSTEGIVIRMVFLNPDGTELYSRDYTK